MGSTSSVINERIYRRKHKKKKKAKKDEECMIINYRDYLLAKAYGGEPRAISSKMSNSLSQQKRSGAL